MAPSQRDQAATALDLTHDIGERGPRTYQARQRLARWLDTGQRYPTIAKDIAWLRKVGKKAWKPTGKREHKFVD